MSNVIDNPRIPKNLKGLTKVRIEPQLIEANERSFLREQQLERFICDALKAKGLAHVDSKSGSVLNVVVHFGTLTDTIDDHPLILVRSDVSLREKVTVARAGTTQLESETWRHRTDFEMRQIFDAGADPQPLIEEMVSGEIGAFLEDWASVNPDLVTPDDHGGENLKIILGIGPVFERKLLDAGINTLFELSKLTDDEIAILEGDFGTTPAAGKTRLEGFREKAIEALQ